MEAIKTEALSRYFGGLTATNGVSLEIAEGDRRAIIGPNGAGKTTLFNLMSGFLFPSSGRIHLFGIDVTTTPIHKRIGLGLSRTFQVTNLFPNLTLFDAILLGVQALNHAWLCFYRPIKSFQGMMRQTEGFLKEWDLWEKKEILIKNLSYGEQRMVEVIVALATRPRLLLLDEPTAGLSSAETALMVSIIKRLPRDITIVLIEHDMDVAFEIAEQITVLHFGAVIAEGTPEQIRGNPRVTEIYLG